MSALLNGASHRPDVDHAIISKQTLKLENATNEAELRAALAVLHSRESAITQRLDATVASHTELSRDLGRLDLLRAGLGTQVIAARSISNDMLSTAAETAGRLSDKVKELDLERAMWRTLWESWNRWPSLRHAYTGW